MVETSANAVGEVVLDKTLFKQTGTVPLAKWCRSFCFMKRQKERDRHRLEDGPQQRDIKLKDRENRYDI